MSKIENTLVIVYSDVTCCHNDKIKQWYHI